MRGYGSDFSDTHYPNVSTLPQVQKRLGGILCPDVGL